MKPKTRKEKSIEANDYLIAEQVRQFESKLAEQLDTAQSWRALEKWASRKD